MVARRFLLNAFLWYTVAIADYEHDWLVSPIHETAAVTVLPNGFRIGNSLISRKFQTVTNGSVTCFGTTDFTLNATTSRGGLQPMLRSIKPEAQVVLDGTMYPVGGLYSPSTYLAFLDPSVLMLRCRPDAFVFVGHKVTRPQAPFPWTPGTRHSPLNAKWPPKGVQLSLIFRVGGAAPPSHKAVEVAVHYALYDGIPLLAKWLYVGIAPSAVTAEPYDVVLNGVTVELLGVNTVFGAYTGSGGALPPGMAAGAGGASRAPRLQARLDQPHGARCEFVSDFDHSSEVNGTLHDQGAVEPTLQCAYTTGPGVHVRSSRCAQVLLPVPQRSRSGISPNAMCSPSLQHGSCR